MKRTAVFVDGQNLFHAAREAFGYGYPNYDPVKLSQLVCLRQRWQLNHVYFYTGRPSMKANPRWHVFWTRKLAELARVGVHTCVRETRPRPTGGSEEKGIDVRIALDVVRLAWGNEIDVAVLFSQDQDLRELVDEIRHIATVQGRWIKLASAFPLGGPNSKGIWDTDWIGIDRETFDTCIDPANYFP